MAKPLALVFDEEDEFDETADSQQVQETEPEAIGKAQWSDESNAEEHMDSEGSSRSHIAVAVCGTSARAAAAAGSNTALSVPRTPGVLANSQNAKTSTQTHKRTVLERNQRGSNDPLRMALEGIKPQPKVRLGGTLKVANPARRRPRATRLFVPSTSGARAKVSPPAVASTQASDELPISDDLSSICDVLSRSEHLDRFVASPRGLLGAGSFGQVRLHIDRITQQLVAIKTFKTATRRSDRVRELQGAVQWRRNPHPHILRLLCVTMTKEADVFALVFPHCRESLEQRFASTCGFFTAMDTHTLIAQIARGADHMHRHGHVHRDIKPGNILLHSDTRLPLRAKITDFGWDTAISMARTPGAQTRPYRAPEVELGLPQTAAMDIWSIGCVLREMLTGVQLYTLPEYDRDTTLEYIMRLGGLLTTDVFPTLSAHPHWRQPATDFHVVQWTDHMRFPRRRCENSCGITHQLLRLQPDQRLDLDTAASKLEAMARSPRRLNAKVQAMTPAGMQRPGFAHSQTSDCSVVAKEVNLQQLVSHAASSKPLLADHEATMAPQQRQCTCDKPHCKNFDNQHPAGCILKRREDRAAGPNRRSPCSGFALDGGLYCVACACRHPHCLKCGAQCEMCVKHWAWSQDTPLPFRVAHKLYAILQKMPSPDVDEWLRVADLELPLPALVVGALMWEPAPMKCFLEHVRTAARRMSESTWKQEGAAILEQAFWEAMLLASGLQKEQGETVASRAHLRDLEIFKIAHDSGDVGLQLWGHRLGLLRHVRVANSHPAKRSKCSGRTVTVQGQQELRTYDLKHVQHLVKQLPFHLSLPVPGDLSSLQAWYVNLHAAFQQLGERTQVQGGEFTPWSGERCVLHKLLLLLSRLPAYKDLHTVAGWLRWGKSNSLKASWTVWQSMSWHGSHLDELPCFLRGWLVFRSMGVSPLLVLPMVHDVATTLSLRPTYVDMLKHHLDLGNVDLFEQARETIVREHGQAHLVHLCEEVQRKTLTPGPSSGGV